MVRKIYYRAFWNDDECNSDNKCIKLSKILIDKQEFKTYINRFEKYINKYYDTLYDDGKINI